MTESSPAIVQFLEEYERLADRVNRSLRDYLGEPGTSQTQNLRASVRRLDAAIKVLPKRTRKEKAVERCHERCRELLRETSRIRDIDILREKLAARSSDPTVRLMLDNLGEERGEFVDRSVRAAWKLFERHPPKLGKKDLPRFARRIETVLQELDEEVGRELRASLADEKNVEELHSLRKDCKRLRYTLELLHSTERKSRLISLLRRWQDILGEIRDMDVRIDYLLRAKPTAGVRSILSEERAKRHAKYVEFVRLCKRAPRMKTRSFLDATVATPVAAR
jgi:CHAD domain-containing protein